MSDKAAKCTHLLHPFCTTCKASRWAWNRALTSQVLRGGGDPAPLEEGVCFGVHHQQPGLVPAGFNGSNDIWMRLTLHRHTVHLKKTKRGKKTERDIRRRTWMRYLNFAKPSANPSKHDQKKKSSLLLFVVVHLHSHTEVNKLHHCQEFFFLYIIGLFAKGSRAGNPVCPHTIAHAQT